MTQKVLILGGQGRIGGSVALDIATHTEAKVTVTSKTARAVVTNADSTQVRPELLQLDLADRASVQRAIANADLVVHCAGPFHYRDEQVLTTCLEQGVDYIDVSDNVTFTRKLLSCHEAAKAAGVTAVINTGIFPGISNSMVRQAVEQFDQADTIHLSYVVSGSGGAGLTVMRTTFLGLMHPFKAWIDREWRTKKPYSDREVIQLPSPYNKVHVYWYEMPETFTLVDSFPVKTVVTKFGSVPDFYNHLTWMSAHLFPKSWIQNPQVTEFLSHVSYRMTNFTDRFSGLGVGIRAEVTGQQDGQTRRYVSTLVHDNTAIAAGAGTGSISELILSGQLQQPGVYPVEQALTTELFEQTMRSRGIEIHHGWES